jgi:hypothetical protein
MADLPNSWLSRVRGKRPLELLSSVKSAASKRASDKTQDFLIEGRLSGECAKDGVSCRDWHIEPGRRGEMAKECTMLIIRSLTRLREREREQSRGVYKSPVESARGKRISRADN